MSKKDNGILNKDNQTYSIFKWLPLFILCVVVFVIYVMSWLLIRCHYKGVADFYEARGTFGDQFGAVNALFSALAFAGMIYALILQMNELHLQREELKDNREEMKRQTDEFQQQNVAMKRQSFENTFFNMMSLQQKIVSDLRVTDSHREWLREDAQQGGILSHEERVVNTYTGRDIFAYIYRHSEDNNYVGLSTELAKGGLQGYAESYYRSYLDHYFRHLYTILKYVDRSEDIKNEDKFQYASILRATLSRYELVLLYYNGLSTLGNEKLKPLLEKYCMLKNLNTDMLILSYDGFQMTRAASPKTAYDHLKKYGLSGCDFELFLTDKRSDRTKYLYSAFFRETEAAKAMKIIDTTNSFLSNCS